MGDAVMGNNQFEEIAIDDFEGKWLVLFFYPADFTFVCPTELEELADKYSELQELGAEVVSVSTDTHFSHLAWKNASPAIKKIKFPMLGDASGETSRLYGVYQEENGLDKRGTFIIDPEGVVRSIEIASEGLGRSVDETIRKIKALKYMAENPGVVCPNKWAEKGTLKPGEDLVGKI
ncbi:redoxin domain-containing protein [Candidatus Gracilibacteria bacterium]|nr:redoxin domain-containing protein [Candidatus Gracilibacteria bacterium]